MNLRQILEVPISLNRRAVAQFVTARRLDIAANLSQGLESAADYDFIEKGEQAGDHLRPKRLEGGEESKCDL